LGDGEALILRNHGLLTVGRTIAEAFNWMHRLELACRAQLAAMATGARILDVPKPVLEATYLNYQPQTRRPYGVMEWPALLRKLDRLDPSYKEKAAWCSSIPRCMSGAPIRPSARGRRVRGRSAKRPSPRTKCSRGWTT